MLVGELYTYGDIPDSLDINSPWSYGMTWKAAIRKTGILKNHPLANLESS
jgi:hypothetical protein